MGDVGAPELLIILAVVLVLFGGAKLPELARSLGKAKREFHKGLDEGMSGPEPDAADMTDDEPTPADPAIEAVAHPSGDVAANGVTAAAQPDDAWWKEHQT